MAGVLIIAAAGFAALFVALALRISGLAATLVAAYLLYVANLGATTLVLSPFRQVQTLTLALVELALLAGAIAFWTWRGRPQPSRAGLQTVIAALRGDLIVLAFGAVIVGVLAYELLLASSPPNNGDSLTYHLTKALAWAQYGGIHWIANAPEVELTSYQPLAEQQLLFVFVATGSTALYALPQYLAELAILTATFASARRLGFDVRRSVCAAFFLGTFSVVVLESVTAQNDLFTASLVASAALFLLGAARYEPALGGAAAALGLGAKLTAGLVVPILAWLAWTRGRVAFLIAAAGGVVGAVTIAMWGYVMNLRHTHHLLGYDTAGVQDRADPGYPRSVANAFNLLYGLMDNSVLTHVTIHTLALTGVAAGVAVVVWARARSTRVTDALSVAWPFLAPLLVTIGAALVAWGAARFNVPIRGPHGMLVALEANLNLEYGRIANEDYSAYGPIGIIGVLIAIGVTVRRRVDRSRLVLALSLPIFLVLISLTAAWVPFLIRYFLLPAVLTAPLLAQLFRGRLATAAIAGAASLSIVVTLLHDGPKQLHNANHLGLPWNYSQATALAANSMGSAGGAYSDYLAQTPSDACVGAIMGPNEPYSLLYGPGRHHTVIFLPQTNAPVEAASHNLAYVVMSAQYPQGIHESGVLADAGWRIGKLGDYWLLASKPLPHPERCTE